MPAMLTDRSGVKSPQPPFSKGGSEGVTFGFCPLLTACWGRLLTFDFFISLPMLFPLRQKQVHHCNPFCRVESRELRVGSFVFLAPCPSYLQFFPRYLPRIKHRPVFAHHLIELRVTS